MKHDHGKGDIKHNAQAALVRSPLFKQRVEKLRKGKGSYTRKGRNKRKHDQWHSVFLRVLFAINRVMSA